MEILKCDFTFQNMCFAIRNIEDLYMCSENRFCTGSGRRTPDLKFVKNSYGFVGPLVVGSLEPLNLF
jgi:hypothetical protein